MPLKDDPRITKGLARLKAKGLKVAFEELETDKWAVIAIDILSIINYIKRAIEKEIFYPNMYVFIDLDSKMIEIHVWRGSTPNKVKELMKIAKEKEELLKEYIKLRQGVTT
jgi:hypothetical protein